MSKFPMQPVTEGRFVPNPMVEYLLDNGGIDMNDLARMPFTDAAREQFAQLIGYSVSGTSTLGYVSNDTFDAACQMLDNPGMDWKDAKIESLETTLETVREGMKHLVPELFQIHPDDLNP